MSEKAMSTYKIIYTESLCHEFYVDATSENEAREKFERQSENGDLDFSNGEVYDSGVKNIFEVREEAKEDGK